ncbi:uncharacterized protein MKK02DRAFT_39739 [Dioszegia hungarica]|uniref:Uncharacterized protein n=1 Tax=Dioszegia hungarica TaxID=4972 RepID=A0AA38HFT7_9TREE|nr:uncharacterized protein MKK02DRAFT_39739 [Dioszegia hungarica]KAI9639442.1 hypothetical protein MKK02DRAFT_39739 [Dioszegia hungarica]
MSQRTDTDWEERHRLGLAVASNVVLSVEAKYCKLSIQPGSKSYTNIIKGIKYEAGTGRLVFFCWSERSSEETPTVEISHRLDGFPDLTTLERLQEAFQSLPDGDMLREQLNDKLATMYVDTRQPARNGVNSIISVYVHLKDHSPTEQPVTTESRQTEHDESLLRTPTTTPRLPGGPAALPHSDLACATPQLSQQTPQDTNGEDQEGTHTAPLESDYDDVDDDREGESDDGTGEQYLEDFLDFQADEGAEESR